MSILINFRVISHSWPERESNIVTADNYIIFNNLIIGQTANDHSEEVNMLGQRTELQFILIRLITWSVYMVRVHTFSCCANNRGSKTAKEAVITAAEKWEGSPELLFPVHSVLLQNRKWISTTKSRSPSVCLEVKTHPQTTGIPHNFHSPTTISNFPFYPSYALMPEHKP